MRFFGIRSQLILFVVGICALIGVFCGLILFNISAQSQKINDVVKSNLAVTMAVQQALLSISTGNDAVALVLFDGDGLVTASDAEEAAAIFEASILTYKMFMDALTWGTDSKSFRSGSGGKVYKQWILGGWDKRLKVYEPSAKVKLYAGSASLYYDGAVKYLRQALAYHLAANQGADVLVLGEVKNKIDGSMRQALRYKRLARESLLVLLDALNEESEGLRSQIFVNQNSKFRKIALFFLVLLLGVCCFTWFFSSVIFIKPIQKLILAARKVAKGERDVYIQLGSKTEIGQLAADFNQMTKALQATTVSRDLLLYEIQEKEKLENIVLQSEKMAAVGQLAGGVAHDLNNQLTPIHGYLDLILFSLPPSDPNREYVIEANQACLRCVDVVARLLAFSRQSPQKKESVALSSFLGQTHKLIKNLLPSAIAVDVEMLSEPINISVNETELQTTFLNLATNARDAMPLGGALKIYATKDDAAPLADAKQGYVRIDVSDTGHGMSEETRSRIFEPFFTTKDKNQGTGLGLSMAFNTLKDHDGAIQVRSKAGEGSTFSLWLPIVS